MKNLKTFIMTLIILSALAISLTACSKNNNITKESDDTPSVITKDYDIALYNYKPEMTETFKEILDYYKNETGVNIKLISADKNEENLSNIEKMIENNDVPTIYTIQGIYELKQLEKYNILFNFTKATQDSFKALIDKIPNELRLSTDNYSNYGLPYSIEGYGYLVDKNMLQDLFDLPLCDNILDDLQHCSYEEFQAMVNAVDQFIKDDVQSSITINSNKYSLKNKTNLTKNLNGVFSVAGADPWTYSKHMLNIALNSKFASQNSAYKASASQISECSDIVSRYAQSLDLKTSLAAGKDSAIPRGEQFIDKSINSYENAIENFANGKSLFLKQGNWAYNEIFSINPETAKRLTILPIKMPIEDKDISVENLTTDKLNSSIPIYVPMYYSINSQSTDLELKLAQDFLVWLHSSEYAKETLLKKFNSIPYDIGDYYEFDCSLNNDILKYMKSENYLSAPFLGLSGELLNNFGEQIKNQYLTKQLWENEDYSKISDLIISEWKLNKK